MRCLALGLMVLLGVPCGAQLARREGTAEAAPQQVRRLRLYLKDGSYQAVSSYRVNGERVRYVSAERGGEAEEIPLKLVDLPATERWTREHDPATAGQAGRGAAIDPELAKEEADRAAITPEVAPNLRLPEDGQVWVMDTFRGLPELLPIAQTDGTVNKPAGHSIFKGIVKPESSPHGVVVLRGETAPAQVHVSQPEFYLRLDDAQVGSGEALTVDTRGASAAAGREEKAGEPNDYVVVRVDVRQDARVVGSFNNTLLGTGRAQADVTEMNATVLPGGHWLKMVPRTPLLIGEYALVEVLGDQTINLGIWDFGVHPQSGENRDAVKPEVRRNGLGRRE